ASFRMSFSSSESIWHNKRLFILPPDSVCHRPVYKTFHYNTMRCGWFMDANEISAMENSKLCFRILLRLNSEKPLRTADICEKLGVKSKTRVAGALGSLRKYGIVRAKRRSSKLKNPGTPQVEYAEMWKDADEEGDLTGKTMGYVLDIGVLTLYLALDHLSDFEKIKTDVPKRSPNKQFEPLETHSANFLKVAGRVKTLPQAPENYGL
ncbi:MAG: hypothetical protein NTV88_05455, partial [Candidatus Micrarchaeota archaeon]|nr:hypothetical protein [Candidatus Micrarchaeota archaeon]